MKLGVFGSYSEDGIDYSKIERLAHLIGQEKPSTMKMEVYTGGALIPNIFVKSLKSQFAGIKCTAWLPKRDTWKIIPEIKTTVKEMKRDLGYNRVETKGETFVERAFWLAAHVDVGLALHGHTGTLVEALVNYKIAREYGKEGKVIVFDPSDKGSAPGILKHMVGLFRPKKHKGYIEGWLDKRKDGCLYITSDPKIAAKLIFGKL